MFPGEPVLPNVDYGVCRTGGIFTISAVFLFLAFASRLPNEFKSLSLQHLTFNFSQVVPTMSSVIDKCDGSPPAQNASWSPSNSCSDTMACTPSGLLWTGGGVLYFSQSEACNLFQRKKIKKIVFVGDSFVRHAFEAFLDILTGDFMSGALSTSDRFPPKCLGEGQFEEANCRQYVSHQKTVCDKTDIGLYYGHSPRALDVFPSNPDLIIWGVGNHPVDGNYTTRYGVLNASIVAKEAILPMCTDTRARAALDSRKTRLFWLHLHARLVAYHTDEAVGMVELFNTEICSIMKTCGAASIDAWTPTLALRQLPEAKNMTWDGVHWGRAVNVLKAHMIITAIAAQE